MRTINLSFRFHGESLGSGLLVTEPDLMRGYGPTDSPLDRNFAHFYHDLLLEKLDLGQLSLAADLATVPMFADLRPTDLSSAVMAYTQLYESQKTVTLAPRMGIFNQNVLQLLRRLFKSLTDSQKRILIVLADYIGNERVLDALGYVCALFLEEKTAEEVKTFLVGR